MKPSDMVMGVGAAIGIIKQIEQMYPESVDGSAIMALLRKLETIIKEATEQLMQIEN
jgi:hypothetical protein